MSRRKWFEERRRAYLLDFQMPDSADQMPIGQPGNLGAVDPAAIVRRLHRAGVQALYVHAKDNQGNCYYDTRYGHKHRAIGARDLMREFSAACREVDMTLLYYVQTSRERRGGLVASYAARHADGRPVVRTNTAPLVPSGDVAPVICLLGPAREYIKNIVRELGAALRLRRLLAGRVRLVRAHHDLLLRDLPRALPRRPRARAAGRGGPARRRLPPLLPVAPDHETGARCTRSSARSAR